MKKEKRKKKSAKYLKEVLANFPPQNKTNHSIFPYETLANTLQPSFPNLKTRNQLTCKLLETRTIFLINRGKSSSHYESNWNATYFFFSNIY